MRLVEAHGELVLSRPLPKGILIELAAEFLVPEDEVRVAGRHVGQHPQRDLVGVWQIREPIRQLVVEPDLLLVNQLEEHVWRRRKSPQPRCESAYPSWPAHRSLIRPSPPSPLLGRQS